MIPGVAFSASLVLLIVLERFANALTVLSLRLVLGSGKGGMSDVKAYASMQMLGSGVSLAASIGSGVSQALGSALVGLLSYAAVALVTTLVFASLYVMQEYYPDVLLQLVDYWNQFLGPFSHGVLLVPLRILNIMFTAVTPAYNFVVWVTTQFLYNAVVTNAVRDISPIVQFGRSTADLFNHTFLGLATYLPTFARGCPSPVTDLCYEPGRRTYDFITPMADLRGMATATRLILGNMCAGASGPFDIALYPLMDINTAKAVHNIGNSILYTLIQLPSVTVQRCRNNPDDRDVMCLPDFEPPINMLVAGLRNLGQMFDNWLDVSTVVVQQSLGIDNDAQCDSLPLALSAANYSRDAFGNGTGTGSGLRVVGLTEGLYAVTDGTSVQYFNYYGATTSMVAKNAWPIPIDVSMGVAAVTYHTDNAGQRDPQGHPSTAMLGCACQDVPNKGMTITCAIALYDAQGYGEGIVDAKEDLTFSVVFQKRSTANYMTCAESEISVQSVRCVLCPARKSAWRAHC